MEKGGKGGGAGVRGGWGCGFSQARRLAHVASFFVCVPPPAARARGPALLQPQASLDLNPCSPPRMVGSKGRESEVERGQARARARPRKNGGGPPALSSLPRSAAGGPRPPAPGGALASQANRLPLASLRAHPPLLTSPHPLAPR